MEASLNSLITEVERFIVDKLSKAMFSVGGHITGCNSRSVYLEFKGITFEIIESEMSSPLDWSVYHGITIIPYDLKFELKSVDVRWKDGDTMTEAVDLRRKAIHNASVKFVNDVLSKLDYAVKRIINNEDIDKILDILDG